MTISKLPHFGSPRSLPACFWLVLPCFIFFHLLLLWYWVFIWSVSCRKYIVESCFLIQSYNGHHLNGGVWTICMQCDYCWQFGLMVLSCYLFFYLYHYYLFFFNYLLWSNWTFSPLIQLFFCVGWWARIFPSVVALGFIVSTYNLFHWCDRCEDIVLEYAWVFCAG